MDSDTCPHCGHLWDNHDGLLSGRSECDVCGCRWTEPKPPTPPPVPEREFPFDGVISASSVSAAFWRAANTTFNDDTIHDLDKPYFDEEMDTVDGHMPSQFWEHMARALAEDDQ